MASGSRCAAITKAGAIYGKRLKKEQLFELINSKTVTDIAKYLIEKTIYKNTLKTLDIKNVHRGQLEVLIRKQAFENYGKIYRFVDNGRENAFDFIIEKFEIEEILKKIMLIKIKTPEKYIISLPAHLISKCNIDLLKLAAIKSFDELLNFFKNTSYKKVFDKLKNKIKSKIDYTLCEHMLYEELFKRIIKTVETKTKKIETFELKKLIKTKIDIINICLIYRKKFFKNCKQEEIKKDIFPFHRNLNNKIIDSLIACEDVKKMEAILKNNIPKFKDLNISDIEKYSSKIEYDICKKYIALSSNATTVFYCFFILQQIEIKNLIYIIEGIRYSMKKEEIKNLLIV